MLPSFVDALTLLLSSLWLPMMMLESTTALRDGDGGDEEACWMKSRWLSAKLIRVSAKYETRFGKANSALHVQSQNCLTLCHFDFGCWQP